MAVRGAGAARGCGAERRVGGCVGAAGPLRRQPPDTNTAGRGGPGARAPSLPRALAHRRAAAPTTPPTQPTAMATGAARRLPPPGSARAGRGRAVTAARRQVRPGPQRGPRREPHREPQDERPAGAAAPRPALTCRRGTPGAGGSAIRGGSSSWVTGHRQSHSPLPTPVPRRNVTHSLSWARPLALSGGCRRQGSRSPVIPAPQGLDLPAAAPSPHRSA